MKAIPHNGYLLCKSVSSSQHEVVEFGIAYQKEELPVYEVISVGDIPDDFRFTEGDRIIVNSIPTKLNLEGTMLFLVNKDTIAGKVLD